MKGPSVENLEGEKSKIQRTLTVRKLSESFIGSIVEEDEEHYSSSYDDKLSKNHSQIKMSEGSSIGGRCKSHVPNEPSRKSSSSSECIITNERKNTQIKQLSFSKH